MDSKNIKMSSINWHISRSGELNNWIEIKVFIIDIRYNRQVGARVLGPVTWPRCDPA